MTKSETRRRASVISRKTKLFVQPYFEATSGVLIGGSPVTILSIDLSNEDLGSALLATLHHTKLGVPHPSDWSKVPHPLYEAAGVRNWATFVKGAKDCFVSASETEVKLIPTRNGGARRGFEHMAERELLVAATSTPAEIGAAVREALSRSE